MATENVGGGSSAVASSTHAACARFRGTDPLITGLTRRNLARAVGFADDSGAIPQARWMRAMTFERLVHKHEFAAKIVTRTVGALGLDRPKEVVVVDAHINVETTSKHLEAAHQRAANDGAATLLYQVALPFVGFEGTRATDVKPDFAVVAPATGGSSSSWLVMGDAKDYERVRSRIDDSRMLKGFLQVAVGAESARAWSKLPPGMMVHTFGVLAVPRNAFLQPEAIVENLHDHQEEVKLRIDERRREAEEAGYEPDQDLTTHVQHLEATFDPVACTTCTLFSYCREELRRSNDPLDLLIELGVPKDLRPQAQGLVDGTGVFGRVPDSTVSNIEATLSGMGQPTGQLRVDQAGLPGTVNVVLAKSDAATLGVHGLGLQVVSSTGRGEWDYALFDEPQSPETRRAIMQRIGKKLTRAMREQRQARPDDPEAIHLVVPDQATADLLVSIADNLAGIELSRLRWQRDLDENRPALTFDGEPASMPRPIKEDQRTAIALLLEDDRSRGFSLRVPIIDVRAVLERHVVAGGPRANSGRLDYLVGWAEATIESPIDHRDFADEIENSEHSPGARLTNLMSDLIHESLVGRRGKKSEDAVADPEGYAELLTEELEYKAQTLGRALDVLETIPSSNIRSFYRAIESDAQAVWRRRLELHASDLVRFGRTYRYWRNTLVPMLESDSSCSAQLLALSNPQAARESAIDAGNRNIALATVVSVAPLVLDVQSRRMSAGTRIVMLTHNGNACVEGPGVIVDLSGKGKAKIDGLSIGPLESLSPPDDVPTSELGWIPDLIPAVSLGDELVVADFSWFSNLVRNRYLSIEKPKVDSTVAPKPDCQPESYAGDPQNHQWCCRPHESREAETSDRIAAQRARGELNPDVWPPVRDGDAFEVSPAGAAAGDPLAVPQETVPDSVTMDDLE